MQKMLSPQNIGGTVKMFIAMGSREVVEQFLEQADLAVDGAEFLACAIMTGHTSMVELFLNKGVKTEVTPRSVSAMPSHPDWAETYR